LAAGIDVILGSVIAFLLIRGRVWGKGLLDAIATMPLAIPGVILATGYLRVFHGTNLPFFHQPLTSLWVILVIKGKKGTLFKEKRGRCLIVDKHINFF
jgi:iron(III) transport system permease protein